MTNEFSPVTLGNCRLRRVAGPFVITDTVHSPQMRLSRHIHRHTCLQLVIKGFFWEQYDRGKKIECRAFSFILKPAGEPHSNLLGNRGAHSLIVEIDDETLEELNTYKILRENKHIRDASLAHLSFNLYEEFKKNDLASELAMEGIVLEIIARLSRLSEQIEEKNMPYWLTQAKEYLNDNYAEPISLSTVAGLVNIDAAHMSRTFKKYFGCSIGDYLREVRLKRAVEKITDSDESLSEIAIECGFYDQSHLNHYFKLMMGVSPAQFQRMVKKKKNKKTVSATSRKS